MIISSAMVHTKNWRQNLKERWLTLSENGILTWRRRDGYMIRGSTDIRQFFDKIDFDFDAEVVSSKHEDSSCSVSCSSNDSVKHTKDVREDKIAGKSNKLYGWILRVPVKVDGRNGQVKKWKNFRLSTIAELDFWLQALANADGKFNPDRKSLIDRDEKVVDELEIGAKINCPVMGAVDDDFEYPDKENRILRLSEKCALCRCSKRWQVAILANIGFIIVFGIRCNIGAAKVRMIHNFTDTSGVLHHPVVAWNAQTLGVIEGSFFYGYLLTQLPGGFISAKFPANKLFGLAIGVTSFFNLFMPTACNAGSGMVVIIQILQGLAQGVAYPAMHGVWRFWAPPLERTKLVTTAFTGSYAGAVIGLPMSAILVSAIGWQAPFYVYGFFGCIWFVFWWFMTFEKPCKHPTISDEEKNHIESTIGHTAHVLPTIHNVPWKSILTSKCVWAIIVANFCRSWTFYLLLIHQLSYMRDVLGMRIQNSGFWAAMPHVVMSIVVLVGGQVADHLRQKGILSTTTVRKIFNCGGFGMEAVFLIVCAYTRSKTGAIASLIFAVGFSGFAISGFNVNHLDLAPRYASILMGMSNGMGTFAGMICPAVTEKLTKTYKARGWETVFLLAGMIHLTGVLFYAIFASGEKQPWAEPSEDQDNEATRAKIGSIGYGTITNHGSQDEQDYQRFQINNKKYSNASNFGSSDFTTHNQNGRHDPTNVRHSDIYAGY